jgi:hypothetical protein
MMTISHHQRQWLTILLLLSLSIVPCLAEWRGGDVSLLPDVEQAQQRAREETGKAYDFKNRDGVVQGVPEILSNNGFNVARVHLFHNPTGKCCDEREAIDLALRMQAVGMDIILDFHFSDDWYVIIVCLLVSMNIQKYSTHSLIRFLTITIGAMPVSRQDQPHGTA